MINVAVWQLVLYILAGVALGAIVAVLSFMRGKQTTGLPPNPQTGGVVSDRGPDPSAALVAAATRRDKVASFLKNRVSNKRNITVDEAAKCLDVSPRRIRRLLDENILMEIPIPGGGRLVSAVSVLDVIARREATLAVKASAGIGQEEPVRPLAETLERREPIGQYAKELTDDKESTSSEESVKAKGPAEEPTATAKLQPGPNQSYWYYVAGHDTPLVSIREALRVLGLDYKYTGWGDIPAYIRKKMRREKVEKLL